MVKRVNAWDEEKNKKMGVGGVREEEGRDLAKQMSGALPRGSRTGSG